MSGEGICKHGKDIFTKDSWCEECFEEGYDSAKLSPEEILSAIELGSRDKQLYNEEIPKILDLLYSLFGYSEHFDEDGAVKIMQLYDKKAKEIGFPTLRVRQLKEIENLIRKEQI